MSHKIKIDQEKCIGCGLCKSICIETFEMKENKAIVKRSEVEKITNENEASDSCPVKAIDIS